MKGSVIPGAILVLGAAASALAQGATAPVSAPPPIRVTMEELHRGGGVPKGWTFLLPLGDPAAGRRVFAALECYRCHEVKGERWPQADRRPGDVGPPLTGMGSHHPAEYFAESIVNPNRVIVQGPGYTGGDGLSKMPDYSESMTVRQLIDVVAYLRSLTGGGMEHEMRHGGAAQPGGGTSHRGPSGMPAGDGHGH
jgi:mono/diheme cytochrome c family protein